MSARGAGAAAREGAARLARAASPEPTWDILITTVPHRHALLCELLADLDRQLGGYWPYVGVRVYRDNRTVSYGDKTQALTEASTADYVSSVDDDDLLAPDGVRRIYEALRQRPDYVGFPVRWTRDGVPQIPVEHSLRHPRWHNGPDVLLRSVMQFNPIRRELALLGTWEGGYSAEVRWGDGVIASGKCKTEVWIGPEPAYLYRERVSDTFLVLEKEDPVPQDEIPPLPQYRWLTPLRTPESC